MKDWIKVVWKKIPIVLLRKQGILVLDACNTIQCTCILKSVDVVNYWSENTGLLEKILENFPSYNLKLKRSLSNVPNLNKMVGCC
jgi:hypothetical protein